MSYRRTLSAPVLVICIVALSAALPCFSATRNAEEPCSSSRVTLPAFPAGSALILGETHGTNEAPGYFFDAVCAAVGAFGDDSLIVALEYPVSQERSLGRYLASRGSTNDKATQLATPFWTNPMKDGRSSQAMLRLLDSLRLLSQSNRRVRIVAFADDTRANSNWDAAMARALDTIAATHPDERIMVLVGNAHAKKTMGIGSRRDFVPMAHMMKTKNTSLAFRAGSGTYWACDSTCGIQRVADADAGATINYDLRNPSASVNFDGIVDLGEVTESSPAADTLKVPGKVDEAGF